MTVSQKRLIVHSVVDYIVKEYGYYPNQDIKKDVSKVVVSLFPCFGKNEGDNVIVSDLL